MSRSWKRMDLAAGGLQAANIRLAGRLKRRWLAYALLALFPLGLHRLYLRDRRAPWIYGAITLVVSLLAALGEMTAAAALAVLLFAAAVFDAVTLERRLVEVNKQIRKEIYLGQAAAPPPGYTGRKIS